MAASLARRTGSALLTCLLTATPLSGCSTIRQVPMDPGIPEAKTEVGRESGQRIEGYTTSDGVQHEFDGWVRLAGPDSLRFRPEVHKPRIWYAPDAADTAADTLRAAFTLARTDVASVAARQGSPGKTTLLVVGIVVVTFGALAALVAATGGMDMEMGLGQ